MLVAAVSSGHYQSLGRGEVGGPDRHVDEPAQRNPVRYKPSLERAQQLTVGVDRPRRAAGIHGVCREAAHRLTNVPLDRMEPVAAVGYVRGPDVLVGRDQVLQSDRDKRPKRYLERPSARARPERRPLGR